MTTPTIPPTQTLEQAILVMQQMPFNKQQEIFDFIALREKKNNHIHKSMTGGDLVALFANVSMTDEETAVFDEIRKDDNSEPIKFD